MKNNMFNMYGQRQPQQIQNGGFNNGAFNSMDQFFDRFNQFRNNFQGNPNDKLQEMLNSGQMSKEQYDKLFQLASKIMGK